TIRVKSCARNCSNATSCPKPSTNSSSSSRTPACSTTRSSPTASSGLSGRTASSPAPCSNANSARRASVPNSPMRPWPKSTGKRNWPVRSPRRRPPPPDGWTTRCARDGSSACSPAAASPRRSASRSPGKCWTKTDREAMVRPHAGGLRRLVRDPVRGCGPSGGNGWNGSAMTELIDSPTTSETAPRSYEVKTYGCQMNVHDSERLSGLLDDAGYVQASSEDQADVVVFNTCAGRENADNRLYGNLGQLAKVKEKHPGLQIAVGGCMAQKDRDTIVKKVPWVDVVFGTHNKGSLPALLERARHNEEAQVEILESLDVFPSTLPSRRESQHSGWVSISVGCNNTCTFCIVPSLRGKEKDRRPGDILAEVEALVADGVVEVTLLGQNVNSYGAEFRDKGAFAKL